MNRASKRPVPSKGTTAFLLKFGLGMEEVPSSRLFASAFTIGASYALGGLVPLVPYFFIDKAYVALYWSIVSSSQNNYSLHRLTFLAMQGITSIILLLFGGLKAWFTVSLRWNAPWISSSHHPFSFRVPPSVQEVSFGVHFPRLLWWLPLVPHRLALCEYWKTNVGLDFGILDLY